MEQRMVKNVCALVSCIAGCACLDMKLLFLGQLLGKAIMLKQATHVCVLMATFLPLESNAVSHFFCTHANMVWHCWLVWQLHLLSMECLCFGGMHVIGWFKTCLKPSTFLAFMSCTALQANGIHFLPAMWTCTSIIIWCVTWRCCSKAMSNFSCALCWMFMMSASPVCLLYTSPSPRD